MLTMNNESGLNMRFKVSAPASELVGAAGAGATAAAGNLGINVSPTLLSNGVNQWFGLIEGAFPW
jgi:hypothetical protein